MTLKAKADGKTHTNGTAIRYNKSSLYRWFKSQGGKDKSPKEKPFLTQDQKRDQKKWCEEEKQQIAEAGSDFHACFIYEKWFYTTSRRRRLKILPPANDEDPDKVAPHIPTTLSRRNSIKSMFMGVVANPEPEHNFDGKIFLKRICKEDTYKKLSDHQNFSDDASLNGQLKDGEWKQLVVGDDMKLSELRDSIALNYFIDNVDKLVIRYSHGNQARYICTTGARIPEADRLDGYTLMVRNAKGDRRMVDVTCDSDFMKEVMPEVGKAIRDAYHWVHHSIPIYLYMDNAGGHGQVAYC